MPGPALLRTAIVALTAALVVSGCTPTGTSTTESTTATSTPGDPAAPESVEPSAAAEPTTSGTTGGDSTGDGSTGSGSTGSGSTGGGQSGAKSNTPSANEPTITYFRVAQKPSCPAGTSANPIPGTPVVLEWKTSNIDSVALSVDGQGVYADNYPPTGSETLNFPCAGGEGDIQRHTYLLTARNSQGEKTKTLVVTATVHDIPEV
ncbi:hypothetical protein [Micromonospora sp. NPDC051296]|uniref:hypothetical protein n=1 Tax=Micromonospora sp. NPDC051296 TaxID=3155046 RepID=UPI003423008B